MRLLQLFKGRWRFSWNPNCLVNESACVPHRYHGMSDIFLHSLSIMHLFVSNLLLNIYGYRSKKTVYVDSICDTS